MRTVDRDLEVVMFVAKFEAVTRAQLREVVFAENASDTPCDRVVSRLVQRRYLAPYKWRRPTGRAGSHEQVYQLGRNGWHYVFGRERPYKALETFDAHKLAIGDFFRSLVALERAHLLEILEYETEPNNHARVGQVLVKPDLFVRLRHVAGDYVTRYWFEVDLDTEHERQIKDKVRRYLQALGQVTHDDAKWNPFPLIVFYVQSQRGDGRAAVRARTIERWVGEAGGERDLFRVCTRAGLRSALGIDE
jgi:hypothetical protein